MRNRRNVFRNTGLYGNDFIGAFSRSNDEVTLVGGNPRGSGEKIISDTLKTRIVEMMLNGSDMVGIYSVMNSKTLILPEMTYSSEVAYLKSILPKIEIEILETNLNALGNNILVNDKIAIINPDYSIAEGKIIGEMLDVEVVSMQIGGFGTVGANNILTNKGIVMNNRVSEEEENILKDIFGNVSQSTADTGSLSIGLCTTANSNGIVAGSSTTGFELANMTEGLGLE